MSSPDTDSLGGAARVVLAERTSAGITVTLLWAAETNAVSVHVHDTSRDDEFEVDVGPDENPLDVFEHPYAYAARRGIEYGSAKRRSVA
jgi:hypothetical protein